MAEGGALMPEGRVVSVKRFAEIFAVEVGIDLGGSNAFMSKHFLDCAKVSPSFDEVCRKGMSKGMGRDVFGDPGFDGQVL